MGSVMAKDEANLSEFPRTSMFHIQLHQGYSGAPIEIACVQIRSYLGKGPLAIPKCDGSECHWQILSDRTAEWLNSPSASQLLRLAASKRKTVYPT
eukprot:2139935-Amphidinium_carterae.1